MDKCTELQNRFDEMKAEGLVNVKFFLHNTDDAVLEEVCSEVLAMLDAEASGDALEFSFHDGRQPQ